jgi:hypothetical protein
MVGETRGRAAGSTIIATSERAAVVEAGARLGHGRSLLRVGAGFVVEAYEYIQYIFMII